MTKQKKTNTAPQPAQAGASGGGEWVMVPRELVKFLNGDAPLDGHWYGDRTYPVVDGVHSPYWWRKYLNAAPQPESARGEWQEAVVEACMRIEGGYKANDPRATLRAIEEWWYQLGVEQTANSFLVEKANAPRPTPAHGDGEVRIGATRCYGDDAWFRELTVQGVTFLAPLDEQDRARHILARPTPEAQEARDGALSLVERKLRKLPKQWRSHIGPGPATREIKRADGDTDYCNDNAIWAETAMAIENFLYDFDAALALPAQGEED